MDHARSFGDAQQGDIAFARGQNRGSQFNPRIGGKDCLSELADALFGSTGLAYEFRQFGNNFVDREGNADHSGGGRKNLFCLGFCDTRRFFANALACLQPSVASRTIRVSRVYDKRAHLPLRRFERGFCHLEWSGGHAVLRKDGRSRGPRAHLHGRKIEAPARFDAGTHGGKREPAGKKDFAFEVQRTFHASNFTSIENGRGSVGSSGMLPRTIATSSQHSNLGQLQQSL